MTQTKFINKEYLVSSLKEFDRQVLGQKYGSQHGNQSVLDKLDVSDDGTLLFDGANISGAEGKAGKSAYESAIANGFVGSESEWLESLKGEKGEHGNDGRSIKAMEKDSNNNIIVTFTDNSTENIGELNVDISADFLTPEGFGNLRYYNGHLQYWDTATEKWAGTSITSENTYIVNVMPKPMQSVRLFYDKRINRYKIRWKEPTDTIVDGQAMCIIEKIVIRRKLNSQVSDENDGELVTTINRRDFGKYENTWFIDEGLEPNEGDVWYYKWFPVTTVGFTDNSTANERCLEAKQYQLYGFVINQNESNPGSMITYIEDNEEFTPVHMDYANDVFDYGDWTGSAFFMNVKPCMLKYDGTVDYFLDPDNYALREDGTPSDIANADYEGNAMVQFPKIWWKIQDNGDNTANIYISDSKVDEDFRCWSHIDAENREIDYCYMPIYNGSNIGGRLRSLSAQTPITATAPTTEISLAMANNIDSSVIWHTEVWSDRMLVNLLLLLIGKTTDTQKAFGNGNQSQQSVITGTMDKRGLFWGNNTTANDTNGRVKVFGMENYWGCPARLLAGLYLGSDRTLRAKLTWGREDGSTADGYNTDGSGYMQVSNVALRNSYGYIKQMQFHRLGLYPVGLGGSATTYYADNMYAESVNTLYTAGYGHLNGYQPNGALTLSQYGSSATGRESRNGASISCKPLARHKEETSDGI